MTRWLPVVVAVGLVVVWALRVRIPGRGRAPARSKLTTTASIEEAVAERLGLLPAEVCVVENHRARQVWIYVATPVRIDPRRLARVEAEVRQRLPKGMGLRVLALMPQGEEEAGGS